ncbi:hypothetical protein Dda_2489 [Drechslerella dactyloides]|uniref:Uncharacterized protein n=1 Tax=Drechslerella dactyloides TaxID=74499 RepID=A0AAD6J3X3_DREDA|nr:hypothetical protein Dda_2489 [Drechslerella dactyloides]
MHDDGGQLPQGHEIRYLHSNAGGHEISILPYQDYHTAPLHTYHEDCSCRDTDFLGDCRDNFSLYDYNNETLTIAESPTAVERRAVLDDATLSAACYCYFKLAPKKTIRRYLAKTSTYYKHRKTVHKTKTICKPTTKTLPCHQTITKSITTTLRQTTIETRVSITTSTFIDLRPTFTTIYPPGNPTPCPISDTVTVPQPRQNQLWDMSLLYAGTGFVTRFINPDTTVPFPHEFIVAESLCEAVFQCALRAARNRWLSYALTRYYGTQSIIWSCDGFVDSNGNPVNFTDTSAWNIPSNRVREAYHYSRTNTIDIRDFSLYGLECAAVAQPGIVYHQHRWVPGYTLNDDNLANPPGSPAPIETEITTSNGCDAINACAAFARTGSPSTIYRSFNVYWEYTRGVYVCRAMSGRSPGYFQYNVSNYDAVLSYGYESYPDGS